jgi:dihydroorotase
MSEPPTPNDPPIFTVADDFDAAIAQLIAETPTLDTLLDELTRDLPDLDVLLEQITAGTPSLDEFIADLETT